jgi:hypothetical protein
MAQSALRSAANFPFPQVRVVRWQPDADGVAREYGSCGVPDGVTLGGGAQHLAGERGRAIRGEERDRGRHVAGPQDAGQRLPGPDRVERGGGHAGPGHTRRSPRPPPAHHFTLDF